MDMRNKYCILFVFYGLILLLSTSGCQSNPNTKRIDKQKASLSDHIGDVLKIEGISDSAGNQVKPDLSKSELTIIDFWFNDCPACIKEMNQFAGLLAGKERKISVISISINQPWLWQQTIKTPTGKFSFLENRLSNWTHYVLQTKDNEKLKNDISTDRLEELKKLYNITFFPAYFVVDSTGIIKARPESAVSYIKQL